MGNSEQCAHSGQNPEAACEQTPVIKNSNAISQRTGAVATSAAEGRGLGRGGAGHMVGHMVGSG